MRLVPALALAALLASPALAQTQYADSSGGFVSLNKLALLTRGAQDVDGTLGYRFSNSTDAGLRIAHFNDPVYDETQLGLITGITWPVGAGFTSRVEGAVRYKTSGGVRQLYTRGSASGDEYDYRFRSVGADVSATVGRRIPLGGSLAFRPSVGGFAATRRFVTRDFPAGTFQVNRSATSAGVQGELPLTFRVLGADAAFVPFFGRFVLAGSRTVEADIPSGALLRLNF